ncbi:hypothetical protein FOZ63_009817, partial [Perkinsus olseni]
TSASNGRTSSCRTSLTSTNKCRRSSSGYGLRERRNTMARRRPRSMLRKNKTLGRLR